MNIVLKNPVCVCSFFRANNTLTFWIVTKKKLFGKIIALNSALNTKVKLNFSSLEPLFYLTQNLKKEYLYLLL